VSRERLDWRRRQSPRSAWPGSSASEPEERTHPAALRVKQESVTHGRTEVAVMLPRPPAVLRKAERISTHRDSSAWERRPSGSNSHVHASSLFWVSLTLGLLSEVTTRGGNRSYGRLDRISAEG
jgi:hypothetical protein